MQKDSKPVNSLDNLKQLASVCNSNNIAVVISQIKKAKQVLERLSTQVNSKLETFTPKETKVEQPVSETKSTVNIQNGINRKTSDGFLYSSILILHLNALLSALV